MFYNQTTQIERKQNDPPASMDWAQAKIYLSYGWTSKL